MNVVIEAKGLMKSYGAKTVVNHVDLQVEKGEIYGFLGPQRCGEIYVYEYDHRHYPADSRQFSAVK